MAKAKKSASASASVAPANVAVVDTVQILEGEFIGKEGAHRPVNPLEAFAFGVHAICEAKGQETSGIDAMARAAIAQASVHNVGLEWLTAQAKVLPAPMRSLFDALKKEWDSKGYANVSVPWGRMRKRATELYAEAEAASSKGEGEEGEGSEGEGEGETLESRREKIRRLTEEGIQALYSRIAKACKGEKTDVDEDIMGLMPNLRDMATQINMILEQEV